MSPAWIRPRTVKVSARNPREFRAFLKSGPQRGVIERAISGALASSIEAHGPITMATRASAAKRVYGAIVGEATKQ